MTGQHYLAGPGYLFPKNKLQIEPEFCLDMLPQCNLYCHAVPFGLKSPQTCRFKALHPRVISNIQKHVKEAIQWKKLKIY